MSKHNGTILKKMGFNGAKVKKWHHNDVKVYSAGNIVTYYVDSGASYQEEVDSEASCLTPKTFTPTKSGWTFVGWREDKTASSSVLSSKVMGDAPITLYAVFKQTVTLTTVANGVKTNKTGSRYYNNGNIANPAFTVSNPTKSGWTFKGWSSSAGSTSIANSTISNLTLSASTTRYAVFQYPNSSFSTNGDVVWTTKYVNTAYYSSITGVCKNNNDGEYCDGQVMFGGSNWEESDSHVMWFDLTSGKGTVTQTYNLASSGNYHFGGTGNGTRSWTLNGKYTVG